MEYHSSQNVTIGKGVSTRYAGAHPTSHYPHEKSQQNPQLTDVSPSQVAAQNKDISRRTRDHIQLHTQPIVRQSQLNSGLMTAALVRE